MCALLRNSMKTIYIRTHTHSAAIRDTAHALRFLRANNTHHLEFRLSLFAGNRVSYEKDHGGIPVIIRSQLAIRHVALNPSLNRYGSTKRPCYYRAVALDSESSRDGPSGCAVRFSVQVLRGIL